MKNSKQTIQGATDAAERPLHRSGAVARMLRMPVATLRVWERRYGLTQTALSSGGQRLYSAGDVRRLALIKQLADRGHAIGSLAPLDMAQLQGVALTNTHALEAAQTARNPNAKVAARMPFLHPWRVAVIGAALGSRLRRPPLLRRLARPVLLLGPFDNVAAANAALKSAELDAVLFHEAHVQEDWLTAIEAVAPALAKLPKAVLYGFAADRVCDVLADDGVALLREPQSDAAVAQWLNSLSGTLLKAAQPPTTEQPALETGTTPPRRWDDATLSDFASQSSTIACECPRQVAELLIQLSRFEAYSAECANRSRPDAEMHRYLRQIASASRAHFEAALEHVALHEGLMVPSSLPLVPADNRAAGPRKARRAIAPKAARPGGHA